MKTHGSTVLVTLLVLSLGGCGCGGGGGEAFHGGRALDYAQTAQEAWL